MIRRTAGAGRQRVVLIGLDGFPLDAVTRERTPFLWTLGEEGGRREEGGTCSLPSTTYPGFASLLTGCLPMRHDVRVTGPRAGAVPGWAGGQTVAVPTILDRAADEGLRPRSVLGDHNLVSVLRLDRPGEVWPATATAPAGVELDAHGYATNEAVRGPLLEAAADRDWDLLFVHLNEVDTHGHDAGPSAPATLAAVAGTDAIVAALLDILSRDWERLTVIVTSDHDMEATSSDEPVILRAPGPLDGLVDDVVSDGGSALVRARAGIEVAEIAERLSSDPRIAIVEPGGEGIAIVGAAAGRVIADPDRGEVGHTGGEHGGPATARTLAIVGGGSASARSVADALSTRRPHAIDWAPTIARILGIPAAGMDGSALFD